MSALEVQNLSVNIGGRRLLDGVGFQLDASEMVALIGPNGAGKTTCLRAILGLVPSRAERVSFAGRAVSDLDARERARAIAYLPQSRHVAWPLGVAATVALGRYPHARTSHADVRRKAERALDLVGMLDFAERDVRTLSGGELALVLLARALAVEAPVLLADEPVAALDPARQLAVMEILRARARAGGAILVVMHDLGLAARYCDRLLLMHCGRIVAAGTPGDVLAAPAIESAYGLRLGRGDVCGIPVAVALKRA